MLPASCTQKPHSRYSNTLRAFTEPKQRVVLFSADFSARRYTLFSDDAIGIAPPYRLLTLHNDADEDCDSTEEVVEMGLRECLRLLEEGEQPPLTREDYDTRPTVKRQKW